VQPEAATRIAVPLLVCLALRCLLPFLFPVYRWISDLPSVQRGWRRQPAGTGGCVYCLLSPRSDRSLLFDFAGAADAMSPLGVGRQWTVDETIVGRLVSSGCRLCLLALLFYLFGCYALLSILVFGAFNLVLQGSVSSDQII